MNDIEHNFLEAATGSSGNINDLRNKYFLVGADSSVGKYITYDEGKDRLVTSVSMEFPPSTLYLGNDMAMSNAVSGIGFKLADGTDAIGLVNRFGEGGSLSNPKFFALGEREVLNVNGVQNGTLTSPIEVQYTTVCDNFSADSNQYIVMIKQER